MKTKGLKSQQDASVLSEANGYVPDISRLVISRNVSCWEIEARFSEENVFQMT